MSATQAERRRFSTTNDGTKPRKKTGARSRKILERAVQHGPLTRGDRALVQAYLDSISAILAVRHGLREQASQVGTKPRQVEARGRAEEELERFDAALLEARVAGPGIAAALVERYQGIALGRLSYYVENLLRRRLADRTAFDTALRELKRNRIESPSTFRTDFAAFFGPTVGPVPFNDLCAALTDSTATHELFGRRRPAPVRAAVLATIRLQHGSFADRRVYEARARLQELDDDTELAADMTALDRWIAGCADRRKGAATRPSDSGSCR